MNRQHAPEGAAIGSEELPTDVIAALGRGRKIEAIKRLCEVRGMDIKAAKEAVEHYLVTRPELQRRLAATQAEARRGCLGRVLFIAALLVAGYYFLMPG